MFAVCEAEVRHLRPAHTLYSSRYVCSMRGRSAPPPPCTHPVQLSLCLQYARQKCATSALYTPCTALAMFAVCEAEVRHLPPVHTLYSSRYVCSMRGRSAPPPP